MTRRGWWLVLLNFLLPGSAQAVAGNRRLGRIGLGATLVMWVLRHPRRARARCCGDGRLSLVTGAWLPDWLRCFGRFPCF